MQLRDEEKVSVLGARELAKERALFAGYGFPVLSAIIAKCLYNPNLMICFESGAIDSNPRHLPHSVSDIINYRSSQFPLDLPDAFAMLEKGDVEAVGLSGAQVDRYGNVNATLIFRGKNIKRLPGGGGSCDFASLGRTEYIFMLHEPRRLVKKVDYITSPGLQAHPRKAIKLITNYGVFAIRREGVLALALESDADPETVKKQAGLDIEIKRDVKRLGKFTEKEANLLRRLNLCSISHK